MIEKFGGFLSLKSYRAWAILSICLQVASVILLKHASNSCDGFFCVTSAMMFGLVFLFMGLRVLFWNFALSNGQLSDVYVLNAFSPILLLIFSSIFLGEVVSQLSYIGMMIVAFAVYMHQKNT